MNEIGLGPTLRAWRDRLAPEAVGLPPGRARRAAGLRREELADLAGLSVDYVVRLEQGRATRPSPQVVGALARALQLSSEERDHLYRLAGLRPPSDGLITDHIPRGMQRVLTRLGDTPAAVFTADWRLIWWNRAWTAVLGDPAAFAPEERNFVAVRFPVDSAPGRIGLWPVTSDNDEGTDCAVVSDLRRATGRYPDDPRLAALVHRTLAGNERFAELWRAGNVACHSEDLKTVHHPEVGDINFRCDVLTDGDTDLKIVVFTTEPGSEDESKLELARVLGAAAGSSLEA